MSGTVVIFDSSERTKQHAKNFGNIMFGSQFDIVAAPSREEAEALAALHEDYVVCQNDPEKRAYNGPVLVRH